MMVSASVFNIHVALSACSLKSTIIIKKNQDPAQRDLQQMPEARKCGQCLQTDVTCMRLWLKELAKGREREQGKEGEREGGG